MRARVIIFGLLGVLALTGFECGKPTEPPGEVEPKYAYYWDRNSGVKQSQFHPHGVIIVTPNPA